MDVYQHTNAYTSKFWFYVKARNSTVALLPIKYGIEKYDTIKDYEGVGTPQNGPGVFVCSFHI